TDAVDEYPNEGNDFTARAVFVDAQPLADLVTSNVVVPSQAVYGSDITVRVTGTNSGSGQTGPGPRAHTGLDTKGNTRPRPRPGPRSVLSPNGSPVIIPGNDAILVGSFGHTGTLAVGASYEQVVTIRIPQQIASGTWYITAWADAYDAVLEDSLATNVNQD